MAVARRKRRAPMQVPPAFHEAVKAEAERRGISMGVLLHQYGVAMVEAIKAQG